MARSVVRQPSWMPGPGPPPLRWSGWRLAAGLAVLLAVAGGTWVGKLAESRMSANIERWTQQKVTSLASQAVLAAMAEVGKAGASRLATYRMDEAGQVVAIEYDWSSIHAVAARAVQALQRHLQGQAVQELAIPLGELTGLRILGARGPRLRVRLVAAGSFEVEPFSEFYAAGFNQTVHRLGLAVRVRVVVVAPLVGQPVQVQARIPMLENQLLGRVPAWLWMPGGSAPPGWTGGGGAGGGGGR